MLISQHKWKLIPEPLLPLLGSAVPEKEALEWNATIRGFSSIIEQKIFSPLDSGGGRVAAKRRRAFGGGS